jgi:antitoxin component YwqK of YwqJK toxin-antitoxin module
VASNTGNLNIYNPVFEKALLHGSFINYKQDGSILDSGYVDNGLKQGLWIEADATTGTYSKGWYNRGNRVQQWKTYDQQGKLLRIEEYQLGKLSWKKEFKNQ